MKFECSFCFSTSLFFLCFMYKIKLLNKMHLSFNIIHAEIYEYSENENLIFGIHFTEIYVSSFLIKLKYFILKKYKNKCFKKYFNQNPEISKRHWGNNFQMNHTITPSFINNTKLISLKILEYALSKVH